MLILRFTADTDDQIDIKIAGADDFRFTANTFTALAGSTISPQISRLHSSRQCIVIAILHGGGIDAMLFRFGVVTFQSDACTFWCKFNCRNNTSNNFRY